VFITVSDVMEYLFCPRFIYFMHCLSVPQHEEKRYKVLKGRALHETRTKVNKDYIRKKLRCVRKENMVYLTSKRYHIKGIVDEVIFSEDKTASPFDYKFAVYKEKMFRTHKYQTTLYGLMIKENYKIDVNRGFICYIRSNNLVKEISISDKDFEDAIKIIDNILDIIQTGYYPKITKNPNKCVDCCYRNLCV